MGGNVRDYFKGSDNRGSSTGEGKMKDDDSITSNDQSENKRVETPIDTDLCLNPGGEKAPKNPLCPVCHDPIRPISNDVERRFVCGCEVLWQFTFSGGDD